MKDNKIQTESTAAKHVGRPLKYETVEELQILIDKYFKDCEGKPLLKENGDPVFDKKGEVILINKIPPVITGLGLALGMTRKSLIDYQKKELFSDAITIAKQRCELYAESCLFTNSSSNGACFNLKNNYGWKDKTEIEHSEDVKYSKLEDFFTD